MKLNKMLFVSAIALLTASAAIAQTFAFGKANDDALQLATVESKTSIETFTGKTNKISGKVTVDRKKRAGKGYIEVDAASIDTGIPTRNEHMRSANWLETDKYPKIRFDVTSVKPLQGDNFQVTGKFTLHGVTKTITANAKVRYLPASDATRKAGLNGDALHISTTFPIKLSDYNVTIKGGAVGKVSETVQISLNVIGSTK